MATDPQTLLSSVNCYTCLSPGMWQLLKLALLKQILLTSNPMADTSPETLLAQARCYDCAGNWQLLELALLAQIVEIGGGSGTPLSITVSHADFVGGQVYTNTGTLPIYVSADLVISDTSTLSPKAALFIDYAGGNTFATVITIGMTDSITQSSDGMSGQVGAWIPPGAKYKFDLSGGDPIFDGASPVSGTCQLVTFS